MATRYLRTQFHLHCQAALALDMEAVGDVGIDGVKFASPVTDAVCNLPLKFYMYPRNFKIADHLGRRGYTMNTDEATFFYFKREYLQDRIRQYETGRLSLTALAKALHNTEEWCVKNVDSADETEGNGINEVIDEIVMIVGKFH
jgi:hypothetical protein